MTVILRGRIRDNRWVDEQALFEAPNALYGLLGIYLLLYVRT